jgi:hypothetical protein
MAQIINVTFVALKQFELTIKSEGDLAGQGRIMQAEPNLPQKELRTWQAAANQTINVIINGAGWVVVTQDGHPDSKPWWLPDFG